MLFVFPPELPVTSNNMNYCIVAFGIVLIIAGVTWIFDGRKHYDGPLVESIVQGKEAGAEPVLPEQSALSEEAKI